MGATRGVAVQQGSETGCLVASGVSTTSALTPTAGSTSFGSTATASAAIEASDAQPTTTGKGSNAGLIGGIVGGILGALLLSLLLFLVLRRRRRGTSSDSWFRRNASDRGIGSAHRYDFGSLASSGTASDSARRGKTEVSGPMNVTHVSGFPRPGGYPQGYEQEEKVMEKREGIPMVPVLPRSESNSSGFMTPMESANELYTRREQESPGGGIEFLASAPPQESAFPIYAPSADHSHDMHSNQSHDRNPSESSLTTDSHAGLIATRPPAPTTSSETRPSEARRVSLYDPQLDRRPSTQARRKSGAPERSGSVRRKPVPVEAYDEFQESRVVNEAVEEKKIVLDVERPLSQGSER